MQDYLQIIYDYGVVPVVKIDRVEDAVPLADAVRKGGLGVLEITYRTEAAEGAIQEITKAFPDMLIGAGTILTTEQADNAIAAGAQFLVSPGLNPRVVQHSLEKGVPMLPGCTSPSEIEQALELGLHTVKFFPAEQSGGVSKLKALCGPYSNLQFMPTGGVGLDNLRSYLDLKQVVACGGSYMVQPEMIAAGDFKQITALTRKTVQKMLGFTLGHIGINAQGETQARESAQAIAVPFLMSAEENPASIFIEREFEIMKQAPYGKNGHIAISTCDIERACAFLLRQGEEIIEESKAYDESGRLKAVYLRRQVQGFAMHLVRK